MMLKLMRVLHVLHMKEIITMSRPDVRDSYASNGNINHG
jgi:hypothetical protein